MTVYVWPEFSLVYDHYSGTTITRYNDERQTGGAPGPDDEMHAGLLGLTPSLYRLQHELAHHLVGGLYPGSPVGGCPILWRDAHGMTHPQPDSDLLEWRITALQYHSMQKWYDPGRIGALMDLEKLGINPYKLGQYLRWLVEAATWRITILMPSLSDVASV